MNDSAAGRQPAVGKWVSPGHCQISSHHNAGLCLTREIVGVKHQSNKWIFLAFSPAVRGKVCQKPRDGCGFP